MCQPNEIGVSFIWHISRKKRSRYCFILLEGQNHCEIWVGTLLCFCFAFLFSKWRSFMEWMHGTENMTKNNIKGTHKRIIIWGMLWFLPLGSIRSEFQSIYRRSIGHAENSATEENKESVSARRKRDDLPSISVEERWVGQEWFRNREMPLTRFDPQLEAQRTIL